MTNPLDNDAVEKAVERLRFLARNPNEQGHVLVHHTWLTTLADTLEALSPNPKGVEAEVDRIVGLIPDEVLRHIAESKDTGSCRGRIRAALTAARTARSAKP